MAKKAKHHYSLPDEILYYEILVCLPAKTLIRFRCASKPWYSIITSRPFRQKHHRRCQSQQQQNPLLFTTHDEYDNLNGSFTLHISTYNSGGTLLREFRRSTPKILLCTFPTPSCQGLVLLATLFDERIMLCNPSTEEIIILPPTQESSSCSIGIGFVSSTDEFKVVRFFKRNNTDLTEVLTLGSTSGTNEWRESMSPPKPILEVDAIFLHNTLHVLPDFVVDNHYVQDDNCILAFNIESEEYKREGIPLPRPRMIRHYYRNLSSLTKLSGSLCFTARSEEKHEQLEIWLLKNYDNAEWAKQYNIDLSIFKHRVDSWVVPVAITGNGSILLDFDSIRSGWGSKLWRYEPLEDKFVQKIDESYELASSYEESLFSGK